MIMLLFGIVKLLISPLARSINCIFCICASDERDATTLRPARGTLSEEFMSGVPSISRRRRHGRAVDEGTDLRGISGGGLHVCGHGEHNLPHLPGRRCTPTLRVRSDSSKCMKCPEPPGRIWCRRRRISGLVHTFVFSANLPNANKANSYFLLGTAGYNAIAGTPHADYTIANSFSVPPAIHFSTADPARAGMVDTTTSAGHCRVAPIRRSTGRAPPAASIPPPRRSRIRSAAAGTSMSRNRAHRSLLSWAAWACWPRRRQVVH